MEEVDHWINAFKRKDRFYTSAARCQSNITLDLQCWDHLAETLAPSGSVFYHIEILHQIFFLKCWQVVQTTVSLLCCSSQFWALQQEEGRDSVPPPPSRPEEPAANASSFHCSLSFSILRIWRGTSGSPSPLAGISVWLILADRKRILENRLHRISTLLRPSIILSIIGGCRKAHFIDCLVIKCTAGNLFWLDLTTSY